MKLMRQIIGICLEREEFFRTNLDREKAFYWHISAYLHCLSYLQKFDSDLQTKRILWYKVLDSNNLSTKRMYFDKLTKFRQQEDKIIIETLNKIDEDLKGNKLMGMGNLYQPGTWGVLTFEFESVN
jgi:hypothetical protein